MLHVRNQLQLRHAGVSAAVIHGLMSLVLLAALTMANGAVSADQRTPCDTGHKLVNSSAATEPPPLQFELTAASRLKLKGTATIGGWSCQSKKVAGKLILSTDHKLLTALFDHIQVASSNDPPRLSLPIRTPAIGELSIPATSLDGNSSGMDHDIWHALKAKVHPTIRYAFTRILGASLCWNKNSQTPYLKLRVLGTLTLAGVTRALRTNMYVRRVAAGRYSIHATSTLLMRNYGVTPPTAFFGLIRGHNRVRVIFDLFLEAKG